MKDKIKGWLILIIIIVLVASVQTGKKQGFGCSSSTSGSKCFTKIGTLSIDTDDSAATMKFTNSGLVCDSVAADPQSKTCSKQYSVATAFQPGRVECELKLFAESDRQQCLNYSTAYQCMVAHNNALGAPISFSYTTYYSKGIITSSTPSNMVQGLEQMTIYVIDDKTYSVACMGIPPLYRDESTLAAYIQPTDKAVYDQYALTALKEYMASYKYNTCD